MTEPELPVSLEAVEKADLGKLLLAILERLNRLEHDVKALQKLLEPV